MEKCLSKGFNNKLWEEFSLAECELEAWPTGPSTANYAFMLAKNLLVGGQLWPLYCNSVVLCELETCWSSPTSGSYVLYTAIVLLM